MSVCQLEAMPKSYAPSQTELTDQHGNRLPSTVVQFDAAGLGNAVLVPKSIAKKFGIAIHPEPVAQKYKHTAKPKIWYALYEAINPNDPGFAAMDADVVAKQKARYGDEYDLVFVISPQLLADARTEVNQTHGNLPKREREKIAEDLWRERLARLRGPL